MIIKTLLRALAAYNKLKQYREGEYAKAFAKLNLYNMAAVLLFIIATFLINITVFILRGDVPWYKVRTVLMSFIAIMFCSYILYKYFKIRLTSRNRERLRNIFVSVLVLVQVPHIYNELIVYGSLYNYVLAMFVVATIPNFKIREIFILIIVFNSCVLIIVHFTIANFNMDNLHYDSYRLMAMVSLLCFANGVRNHVNYLRFTREKSLLQQAGETDMLTGMLNRRGMERYIAKKNSKKQVTICILDIDNFKSYNDTYGHEKGDQCLVLVANCLREVEAKTDCICVRYGGEEFVVIFFSDSGLALSLLNVCRIKIRNAKILAGVAAVHPYVTISGGLATSRECLENVTEYYRLIARADQLLYKAKQSGKNEIFSQQN